MRICISGWVVRPEAESLRRKAIVSLPHVVSRDQWLAAREELLAEEKRLARARDALGAVRRALRDTYTFGVLVGRPAGGADHE